MKQYNFLKEKKEYLISTFRSREGLADFFVGTAVFGFVIVSYVNAIFDYISSSIPMAEGIPKTYLTFLVFGLVLTGIDWVITLAVVRAIRSVKI